MDQEKAIKLIQDIDPKDQVDALNGMVLLVNVVYKRGGYSISEAAKIWECMEQFSPPQEAE